MTEHFPFVLCLIVVITFLIMLARRIRVAYPILLVVAGLITGFIPGIPSLQLSPAFIFTIFLPPLLYEAAWAISWKELWRWRRIVGSFALVVVFLSALSVALVANYFIPGFSLALGFLLGGIVSPPDAVSAGAILNFIKVPTRMRSILEGESLLNDASSLIIFRFALIAVATGQFIWYDAAISFSWMLIGGIGIGVLIGWIFMTAHRFLPTDANTDIVLSVVTPYMIYLVAEAAHSSGVLAVVSGGLYLSVRRYRFLSSHSRLRGVNVWESLVFVLNGFVFLFIGLSLPMIIAGLGAVSLRQAIGYGVLVTGVLVVARMLSAYGAVVVTLIARNFIQVADARNPGLKVPFLLGWTGMRGVVSLAAALSIPATMSDGTPFPQRNLILLITFIVILLTLLVQGLTLPYFIRKFPPPNFDNNLPQKEAEEAIRAELAEHALSELTADYSEQLKTFPVLQQLKLRWSQHESPDPLENHSAESKMIYLDMIRRQRKWLLARNTSEMLLDEEVIRKHLQLLDLEEEKLRFL